MMKPDIISMTTSSQAINGGSGELTSSSSTTSLNRANAPSNSLNVSSHTLDKVKVAKVTLEYYYDNLIVQYRERQNRTQMNKQKVVKQSVTYDTLSTPFVGLSLYFSLRTWVAQKIFFESVSQEWSMNMFVQG
ncbi:unnamed protein product [Heterobilharzia americana]|nr:unnamed protein product [Heterobilharzia americana]